jgi:flagellar protein FlbD
LISLTLLSGRPISVNPTLIETLESTPDTVITLTTGKKLIVRESLEEISILFSGFFQEVGMPVAGRGERPEWT